ncbi:hypothetical protein Vc3S01_1870 [Vibrio campbellii]|nr:hypothetical protein Vc3S01_1870 [Vibrio campbellii]EDL68951.1 hypothetical protein A1Q_2160 [Vibrio campbellii HY01]
MSWIKHNKAPSFATAADTSQRTPRESLATEGRKAGSKVGVM